MDAGATNGATVCLLGYGLPMRSQLSPSRASASKPPGWNVLAGTKLGPVHPDARRSLWRPPCPIPRYGAASGGLHVPAGRLQLGRPAASTPPRWRFRRNRRSAS
jgi:hypothetical protein